MMNVRQGPSIPTLIGVKYRGGLAMVNLGNLLAITVHHGSEANDDTRVSVMGVGTQLDFVGDDARDFLQIFNEVVGFRTPEA
jgi:hypothetical protein